VSNRGAIWSGVQTFAQQPNVEQLAVDTANRIAERPSTIVVKRDLGDGTYITLEPQTVRLEVVQSIRDSGENRDAMVAISKQYVVAMGYRSHPTIPNTDVQRGDTFYFQNRVYEVQEIIDTLPGRLMFSTDLTP
jgi:hypothetical protein